MRWRGWILAIVALAGCGDGVPEAPAVPADAVPEASAVPVAAGPDRRSLEIVEGETVAVPVRYLVSQPSGLLPLYGEDATIGLEASYGTASAEDILLMERTMVPLYGSDGEGAVELGLRALSDGTAEGAETLVLRPVVWDRSDQTIRVRDAEIEVVITDEPYPCSEVEVRVGESPSELINGGPLDPLSIYALEIEVVAPASESVIGWIKWIEPGDYRWDLSDFDLPPSYHRTRTLNAWRVESLGDRVRHRMKAQWWNGSIARGSEPPRLELQVCGGPGYGKFVRCSTTECAVHEEGS